LLPSPEWEGAPGARGGRVATARRAGLEGVEKRLPAPSPARTRRRGTPGMLCHVPHVALLADLATGPGSSSSWSSSLSRPRGPRFSTSTWTDGWYAPRVWLKEPVWPKPKEAAMARSWRCRVRLHRWQRIRGPDGQWYRECRDCRTQLIDRYKEGPHRPRSADRPIRESLPALARRRPGGGRRRPSQPQGLARRLRARPSARAAALASDTSLGESVDPGLYST
jgi:hypothetical protein